MRGHTGPRVAIRRGVRGEGLGVQELGLGSGLGDPVFSCSFLPHQ